MTWHAQDEAFSEIISTPPLMTYHGRLVIYHAVDSKGVYRVGAMMLDAEDPSKILARTPQPIMERETYFEWHGLYPHAVVFPTANAVLDGILHLYYGVAPMKQSVWPRRTSTRLWSTSCSSQPQTQP